MCPNISKNIFQIFDLSIFSQEIGTIANNLYVEYFNLLFEKISSFEIDTMTTFY